MLLSWIADNGYDKDMGARPMERFISKNIKKPLVDKLLVWKLKSWWSNQVRYKGW